MSGRHLSRTVVALLAAVAVALGGVVLASPAAAAPGGPVSGTVTVQTGPSTFAGAAGIRVTFFPVTGTGAAAGSALTNGSGDYTVAGLEQGEYRVYFAPESQADTHVAVWRGDQKFEADSPVLAVGAGATTGVNATLAYGGSISGTITTDNASNKGAAAAFLFNPALGTWERFSRWTNASSTGVYTINGLHDGDYLLRFADRGEDVLLSTEYWDGERFWTNADIVTIAGANAITGRDASLISGGIALYRLSGADRFETSVRISQTGFPSGSQYAFVVNGVNFPDALSADPAAALLDAPVLLTGPDSLPASIETELARLDPDIIFIIGGTPSVSASVASELASLANDDVVRIAGVDRFDTSRKVAREFFEGPGANSAYIATGLNFPDALSAAPAAGNEWGPVVLVNGGAAAVDSATSTLLSDLGVTKVTIAGSAATVSTGVEQSLQAKSFLTEVYRQSGPDRFQTSIALGKASFRFSDAVFLATGLGFPDALAGAALAGNGGWHAPIYLVQKECIPQGVIDEIGRLKPAEVYILGGTPSVGAGVVAGTPCPS